MRRFLNSAILAVALIGFAAEPRAQYAIPEEADAQRVDRIRENLQFRFPQIREALVVVGEIVPTDVPGVEAGSFTVNGRDRYPFLIVGDATLYLLSSDPVDVSLSPADIAAALEEERLAEALEAEERRRELEAFTAGMPSRGAADAPVTLVEFSDFQCPFCARAFETVEQVLEKYPREVRLVYLNFPLGNHPWAMPAAVAAVCAAEQSHDAFWVLHDGYFRNQPSFNPGNVLARSRDLLTDTGIDLVAWESCAADPASEAHEAAAASVEASAALASRYGLSGTPGFFVNGRFINGALPLSTFEEVIGEALSDEGP